MKINMKRNDPEKEHLLDIKVLRLINQSLKLSFLDSLTKDKTHMTMLYTIFKIEDVALTWLHTFSVPSISKQ